MRCEKTAARHGAANSPFSRLQDKIGIRIAVEIDLRIEFNHRLSQNTYDPCIYIYALYIYINIYV